MQPDTGKRITSRGPFVACISFRISAPSHRTESGRPGRPDLNPPIAQTTSVLFPTSLSVLLTWTLLAALIGCGPLGAAGDQRRRSTL